MTHSNILSKVISTAVNIFEWLFTVFCSLLFEEIMSSLAVAIGLNFYSSFLCGVPELLLGTNYYVSLLLAMHNYYSLLLASDYFGSDLACI